MRGDRTAAHIISKSVDILSSVPCSSRPPRQPRRTFGFSFFFSVRGTFPMIFISFDVIIIQYNIYTYAYIKRFTIESLRRHRSAASPEASEIRKETHAFFSRVIRFARVIYNIRNIRRKFYYVITRSGASVF